MAIEVSCPCGQRFKAQPHLYGKRVSCPTCGHPLDVPSPRRPAPAAAKIPVVCACGTQFNAQPHLAGKRVKCPGCGNPLVVSSTTRSASSSIQSEHPSSAQSLLVDCRCGQRFKARADLVGKTVRCSSCGQPLVVKAATAVNTLPSDVSLDLGSAAALDDPLASYGTHSSRASTMTKRRPARPASNPLPIKTVAWIAGGALGLVLIVVAVIYGGKMILSAYREAVANTDQAIVTDDPADDTDEEPAVAAITSRRPETRDDAAQVGNSAVPETSRREQQESSLSDAASNVLDAVTPDLSSPTAVYKHSQALTQQGRFEDLYDLHSASTRTYFDSHAADEGYASGREYFGTVLAKIGKGLDYVADEPEFKEKRNGNRCVLTVARKDSDLLMAARFEFIREGVSWRFYSDKPEGLIRLAEKMEEHAARAQRRTAETAERADKPENGDGTEATRNADAHRILADARRRHELEESVPSETISFPEFPRCNRTETLECVAISADGRFAACGANTGHAYIVDTATGTTVADFIVFEDAESRYGTWLFGQIAISIDRKRLITCDGSSASSVDLWDGASGEHIARLQDESANAQCFSPDGRYVAASDFTTLRVFEAETGKPTGEAQLPGAIMSLQFSPDAKSLAVALVSRAFTVRRLADGREQLTQQVEGGGKLVVAFSPDGGSVLTQAGDSSGLTLWDLSTGRVIHQARHDLLRTGSIALMPDGVHATVMSGRGIDVWNLPESRIVKRFKYTDYSREWSLSQDGTLGVIVPSYAISAEQLIFWRWSDWAEH